MGDSLYALVSGGVLDNKQFKERIDKDSDLIKSACEPESFRLES
jgi:hypothetical protein